MFFFASPPPPIPPFPPPPSTSLDFIFAAAALPNNAVNGLSRLVYTVGTIDSRGPSFLNDKVTGCLASIDAEGGAGALTDWFCVKRDMSSAKRDMNYLATSPLIALNARGANKHTLFVMQYDTVVLVLDPSNLKGGLLYALDPLPNQDQITIATDFLAMTARGTLLWEGWDSTVNDATILALPGVLNCPPGTCGTSSGGGGGGGGGTPHRG